MEENQTVEQESSEASAPEPDIATVEPKLNTTLDFLQRLVVYCPWLLVVVLLALFIGGGMASLYSLSHVEDDLQPKQTSETELVEVVNPITSPSENTNPLPLWMVGAIALSCASGCVVILRWLNRPIQIQTTHKHVNRYQARLAQRRQQHVENNTSKNKNTLLIVPPPQAKAPTPPPAIKKTKQIVTILPSTQNQVLVKKESLADSMDIRKQNSLSSMLHKDK
jgi:hypothetical protein